ncbi:splicing factor 3B subunit 2 [Phlebotomus argentipes]|uniref:splicing factor 3B subunit 2 n=1 Tax=Phlebotomus argentipes TaxID=94469 RepID=UPI00289310F4|nr:splicing factor 3B subunit 2 [Phlebotomus argentipes]
MSDSDSEQLQQNAFESMAEHEAEMQRQMMSVPPPGIAMGQLPPPGTMPVPPPAVPGGPPGTWSQQDSGNESDEKIPSLMSLVLDKPDEVKAKKPAEVVLPKALEEVLALKDQRAMELGSQAEDIMKATQPQMSTGVISTDYADADVDSDDEVDMVTAPEPQAGKGEGKVDKNRRKKKRKKQNRQQRMAAQREAETKKDEDGKKEENGPKETPKGDEVEEDVQIEYVPEKITIADLAPMYRQFYRVFEMFKIEEKRPNEQQLADQLAAEKLAKEKQKLITDDMDEDEEEFDGDKAEDKERMSKRKLKKLTRLSVAELKQLVSRPDVVEMHDVTARDPKLLVQLKAHRNTVQVPRHWCFKRKYLQGKRGIEKPPFDLPAFIKKTGIMEMRASLQEKDEAKTLKAKMRERARPKMGKIDIDYQKLHDAFFKWQTKPRMTIHGDLYYEGKEFETRLKEKKPGDLSEELRTALGMPIGPNCHKIPPPWLIAQQRYGPPPSYPNLKIPGLNAPIPDGTSFGYHAGGWGKPPVDEKGKPLYGDVFGTNALDQDSGVDDGEIDRQMWGELESESEESSEEEEEEGEDLGNAPDESGLVTPAEGLVTPSGLTSVPAGMETPDTIELRKKKIESEMEDNETPVLYHVLPEKRNERIGNAMMASTHVYDVAGHMKAPPPPRFPPIGEREGMVELALDPSELDMDNEAMAQRYEQQMREQQSHLQKEDLSDMLAEHVARQKSKRKRQQVDTSSKQTKKYKEFKF